MKTTSDLVVSNSGLVWSIRGWEVRAESLLEAMWAEVGYRQCLAYKLFVDGFDELSNKEFCAREFKEVEGRDPEEEELNKLCWEQEDVELGWFFDELRAAKSDTELMDIAGLNEDEVQIQTAVCQSPYCHADLNPVEACPDCAEVWCPEHYDEDGCPGCGYKKSSMDLMAESVVE